MGRNCRAVEVLAAPNVVYVMHVFLLDQKFEKHVRGIEKCVTHVCSESFGRCKRLNAGIATSYICLAALEKGPSEFPASR